MTRNNYVSKIQKENVYSDSQQKELELFSFKNSLFSGMESFRLIQFCDSILLSYYEFEQIKHFINIYAVIRHKDQLFN